MSYSLRPILATRLSCCTRPQLALHYATRLRIDQQMRDDCMRSAQHVHLSHNYVPNRYSRHFPQSLLKRTYLPCCIATLHINMDRSHARGYHALAQVMCWSPTLAILPRFRNLNILNLLYLQASISELEEDLAQLVEIDETSGSADAMRLSRDWSALSKLGEDDDRWKTCQTLRTKLDEYNRALIQQITLRKISSPSDIHRLDLQNWLKHPEGGNSELRGPGALTWATPQDQGRKTEDLISIWHSDLELSLPRRLVELLLPLLRRLSPKLKETEAFPSGQKRVFRQFGSHQGLLATGDQITSFLASILILVPVIVLHFIGNPSWRLAVIVLFTLTFSAFLVVTTGAKRSEVFAATAAFVAVQVVYIGGVVQPKTS